MILHGKFVRSLLAFISHFPFPYPIPIRTASLLLCMHAMLCTAARASTTFLIFSTHLFPCLPFFHPQNAPCPFLSQEMGNSFCLLACLLLSFPLCLPRSLLPSRGSCMLLRLSRKLESGTLMLWTPPTGLPDWIPHRLVNVYRFLG